MLPKVPAAMLKNIPAQAQPGLGSVLAFRAYHDIGDLRSIQRKQRRLDHEILSVKSVAALFRNALRPPAMLRHGLSGPGGSRTPVLYACFIQYYKLSS